MLYSLYIIIRVINTCTNMQKQNINVRLVCLKPLLKLSQVQIATFSPTYIKYLCVTDNASTDRPQKDQLMSATYTTQLQDQHLHAQAPSTECVL